MFSVNVTIKCLLNIKIEFKLDVVCDRKNPSITYLHLFTQNIYEANAGNIFHSNFNIQKFMMMEVKRNQQNITGSI